MLMYAEIMRELLAFYAKYATNTGLTIQEVMKKADDFDVYAFRNKAKKYVKRRDFSDDANKALKLYNLSMKVSREKLLKQQLDLIVKDSTLDIQDKLKNKLVEAVDREVERQAHILGEHVKIDDTEVKAVVNSNFKGDNWSTRLWQDMALVQKEVEKTTSNVLLRGRHPNEYVSEFKKQTNSTTYNAGRLLVTESARVQAESQKLTYLKELGEDGEYKYVAKIDKKTSKICHSLNGKVFKVKDMIPGVNAPPMHPWCRSTTVPHVGNWRDKFFTERSSKNKVHFNNKYSFMNNIISESIANDIKDGKLKLSKQKQNRHIKGTKEYVEGKSYFTVSFKELQDSITRNLSNIDQLRYSKDGKYILKLNLDKSIGRVVNQVSKKEVITQRITLHIGKNNFHAVPAYEWSDKNERY